jgi:hypothetical protein
VIIAGSKCQFGFGLAGSTVTMRLDGHLMHAIAAAAPIGTWPCPITAQKAAGSPAPAPPPPRCHCPLARSGAAPRHHPLHHTTLRPPQKHPAQLGQACPDNRRSSMSRDFTPTPGCAAAKIRAIKRGLPLGNAR